MSRPAMRSFLSSTEGNGLSASGDKGAYPVYLLLWGAERCTPERPVSNMLEDGLVKVRMCRSFLQSICQHNGISVVSFQTNADEELAFVNNVGMRTDFREKLDYTPPKDDLLTKYYSDAQLSSKERLALEIKKLREEFQTHDCDSGSPQVEIAILTTRINNLNRHMREGPNYKRDKHSKKGLSDMVQYRNRMLLYLRRRDWPVYCNVLTKLKLDDVILEKRR